MSDSVKSLVFTFGGVIVWVTCVWVFLNAVKNIRYSLTVKDWRIIVWNVVVSIISVACSLACLYLGL